MLVFSLHILLTMHGHRNLKHTRHTFMIANRSHHNVQHNAHQVNSTLLSRTLADQPTVVRLVIKYAPSPWTQQPANGSYLVPVQSSSRPQTISLRTTLIRFCHSRLRHKWRTSVTLHNKNIVGSPHTCYMTRRTKPPWCSHPNNSLSTVNR